MPHALVAKTQGIVERSVLAKDEQILERGATADSLSDQPVRFLLEQPVLVRDLGDDRYELIAFGAKIMRRRGRAAVERVLASEPIEGSESTFATPTQLGGTRHLSAAQFVHDQRDAIALVASQDGKFTIFQWSPEEEMVHGHRVEALLL